MATANLQNVLLISDPDFDTIKTNLKNFLGSQSTFSDYDFEGSALSVLIDLLAYNTHYMAFYANMLGNESFLDTAVLRDSVVSHAKMLGYTPHSTLSARARVNLSLIGNASTVATLPKFSQFVSTGLNGVNYTFTNLDQVTVSKNTATNVFTFSNLILAEGTPVSYVYTYDSTSNPNAQFNLPDAGVDLSTIQVIVQNSSQDSTQTVYTIATDSTIIDGESNVFFVDEIKNSNYSIYFGNGVIGNSLTNGNVVIINYLISSGAVANKANNFTFTDSVYTSTGVLTSGSVTMIQSAAGGASIEGIDSIKFIAPKAYISNNRAVTKNDYITLIQKKYPALSAVNVWGGEENVPPIYGKVFISAKPALGYEITAEEKRYIAKEVISPLSILTVTPEFVDPNYIYLRISSKITYDPTLTSSTPDQISLGVKNAIYSYAASSLNQFNSYFKPSKLMRDIDDSNISISSNQIEIQLEKRLEPVIGSPRNYTINFNTELQRLQGISRIYSSKFILTIDGTSRNLQFEETPLTTTGIQQINVFNGGSDLEVAPTLIITGDGYGATANSTITNGSITSVTVTDSGIDYSTAKITAYDRDGNELTDIVLIPVFENSNGSLRAFYFDDNQNKTYYNWNSGSTVGSIDYSTGKITLSNFDPVDIIPIDPTDIISKTLKFYASPKDTLLFSNKNSILTVDTDDTSSITVTLIALK